MRLLSPLPVSPETCIFTGILKGKSRTEPSGVGVDSGASPPPTAPPLTPTPASPLSSHTPLFLEQRQHRGCQSRHSNAYLSPPPAGSGNGRPHEPAVSGVGGREGPNGNPRARSSGAPLALLVACLAWTLCFH